MTEKEFRTMIVRGILSGAESDERVLRHFEEFRRKYGIRENQEESRQRNVRDAK